jgi:hypothetical protein
MSLIEFAQALSLPVERVALALDAVVAIRVFCEDNSFRNNEIGEIIYMFAANKQAQAIFDAFIEGDENGKR